MNEGAIRLFFPFRLLIVSGRSVARGPSVDEGVQHSIRVRAIYWRLMSAAHSNNNNNNSSDVGGVLGPKYEGPAFLFHSFTQWLVICSLNNSPPPPSPRTPWPNEWNLPKKFSKKLLLKKNSKKFIVRLLKRFFRIFMKIPVT